MSILEKIRNKARENPMKIALPECGDLRTLKAASIMLSQKTAIPFLVGNRPQIEQFSSANGISISGMEIFDITSEKFLKDASQLYLERMKSRGVSEYEAYEIAKNPLYAGCLLVSMGIADGVVSGATHTTADSVRAYLRCFGTKRGIKTVSSFFLMVLKDQKFGDEGVMLYSDCGIVANPTSEQLAEIAILSKESYEFLVGKEARIAFLSFSTKGSAKDPSIEKIIRAMDILKNRASDMVFDGELQFDAAVIPEIGAKKAPGSKVAGRANVVIFPDLNSGNIAYKITERIGGAIALGPILQGVAKAANDLSRGCSAE
ncbi:MAG: phosphate acyltransferase, partial [Acidobacteria bacterium]|nr:phosphate acyltransferase [Acidobacteriota bacterium]